jgi:uncharacterized protein with GYD domain
MQNLIQGVGRTTELQSGERYKYQELRSVKVKMPTYVVLANFTQKCIENIKDLPKPPSDITKIIGPWGVKFKDLYFTMGRYDSVAIMEAPDDNVMTKALLQIGIKGFFRTETLKAITPDELAEIVKELP